MPQGGVEAKESLEEAAYRELKEEIGSNNIEIITRTSTWLYYDFPPNLQQKLWRGAYVGQKQIWFLARFLGEDNDINLETETPEFSAWKWATLTETIDLIVPFKRQTYQQVLEHFEPFLEKMKP